MGVRRGTPRRISEGALPAPRHHTKYSYIKMRMCETMGAFDGGKERTTYLHDDIVALNGHGGLLRHLDGLFPNTRHLGSRLHRGTANSSRARVSTAEFGCGSKHVVRGSVDCCGDDAGEGIHRRDDQKIERSNYVHNARDSRSRRRFKSLAAVPFSTSSLSAQTINLSKLSKLIKLILRGNVLATAPNRVHI